jgi:hypothetical protein
MPRRSDEAEAEPLDVVKGVVEGVDLEFAAVARAGIDLADRQAAPQPTARRVVDLPGQFGERGIVRCRRRLGQRRARQAAKEKPINGPSSYRSCPE